MLLSKACEYGLRAALYMALEQKEEYISIRNMSKKLDISYHFLTKILQQLTKAGLMESYKGPNGGVRLAEKSGDIQLFEIVKAIDGDELFTECVLGLPGCGERKPCALHQKWANHREEIKMMLKTTTLQKLAEESRDKDFRLTFEKSMNEL